MCKVTSPLSSSNNKNMKSNSNPTTTATATATAPTTHNKLRVLYSLESFRDSTNEGRPPSRVSFALTVALVVGFLCCVELLLRFVFQQVQHWHPIWEKEENRQIMARHIGVDALSCAWCAYLGLRSRHLAYFVRGSSSGTSSKHPHPPHHAEAASDARLFTYHPQSFQVALIFFAYQIKNLHDSYVWNDGWEFLFHHVFSLITAWGSMYPGCAHVYAVFFFGFSEISTAVLCLLANFDPKQGIEGLDEAFPMVKVVLGVSFVILFIICRCILWPLYSYHFGRDVLRQLKIGRETNCERTKLRKNWLKFFLVSMTGLSILQVAWLGQIILIARDELQKLGFL